MKLLSIEKKIPPILLDATTFSISFLTSFFGSTNRKAFGKLTNFGTNGILCEGINLPPSCLMILPDVNSSFKKIITNNGKIVIFRPNFISMTSSALNWAILAAYVSNVFRFRTSMPFHPYYFLVYNDECHYGNLTKKVTLTLFPIFYGLDKKKRISSNLIYLKKE